MNNFILLLINAMAHAGVFTKDEAEELCKQMQYSTLPDNFDASWQHVEKIFAKADVGKKVETSLGSRITALVKRVESLEKPKKK